VEETKSTNCDAMNLKPIDLEISSEAPFKSDALNREGQAAMLTMVVNDLKVPFVLAIDGSFGMGKTTFIKMWCAQLHKEEFTTLYFNAWENDFTENALVSLLGELRESLQLAGGTGTKLSKAALKMGAAIAKHGAVAALKAATAGLIDSEKIAETIADVGGKSG
jgi:predicted KAP-like P-loop ATPase